MTLTSEHRAYLNASAITDAVIDAQGIDSTELGIVFPWRSPDGTEIRQLRPNVPEIGEDGRARKYVWPSGQPLVMNRLRDDGAGPVLIVEGTKQQYAALSHAPSQYAVYGLSGCWGWVSGDRVSWLPDVLFLMGREVYLLFDADITTNYQVHRAATELTGQLKRSGVPSVRYVRTTARGTNGLDDVLAAMPEDRRAVLLALWLDQAEVRLPKAPRKPPPSPFIADNGSLLVEKATKAVMDRNPAALTAEREVALYLDGAYRLDKAAFISQVVVLLGDLYKREWRANILEVAIGLLYAADLILPERQTSPLLNVRNGMLDLPTMTLKPHDPVYMSSAQLPITWEPEATCPTYDEWIMSVIPDQWDDLEEVAATMLDPSRTPAKALFCFGPSRSGKSTFIRIMQALAGVENRSAVTLHQLCSDRFAAANVYGKILNAAADLSASEVSDLSIFKMMTGEDAITGNRKYGTQFDFTNRALFAFSANELPTVGEASRAYLERIKPFEFKHSFAGHENPAIESQIMNELPGVLVRWVHAWHRMHERGGYTPTLPSVRESFEIGSNRVRQWVAEMMVVRPTGGSFTVEHGQGETATDLHRMFGQWTEDTKTSVLGRKRFVSHLTSINGVVEVRIGSSKTRGYNVIKGEQDPPSGRSGSFTPTVEGFWKNGNETVTEGGSEGIFPGAATVGRETATTATPSSAPVNGGQDRIQNCHSLSVAVFDLETASADELYRHPPQDYIRLMGWDLPGSPEVRITAQPHGPEIMASTILSQGHTLGGHNIAGFDLQALARVGLDLTKLRGKIVDTLVRERLIDPPLSGKDGSPKMPRGYYGLNASCERRGLPAKTDELPRLAKLHGGYDQIPTDDPEYRDYLTGDVVANRALLEAQGPLDDYARREMDLALITAQMSVNGMRVDVDELAKILAAQAIRRQEQTDELVALIDLPLGKWKTYKTKADVWEPFKSPLSSAPGKAALHKAMLEFGLPESEVPWTAKGELSTSQDAMRALIERCGGRPRFAKLERLCGLVSAVVGERTVFQSADAGKVLDPDGVWRYHPSIAASQASGRWSVSLLTVFGKRDGKHVERRIFLPEDGHVFFAVDLNQIDNRSVAALSQDPDYMRVFLDDLDIHTEVSKAVFGTDTLREKAKAIGHGWNYGEGVGTMVKNGADPQLAVQFDREMRRKYPRLVEWRGEVEAQARAGQLLDNGHGRLMRADPNFAYTQGPALSAQGCTRDLVGEGMIKLPSEHWRSMKAIIHDEVLFSVPVKDAEEISREVVKAYTFDFKGVPITAGCSRFGRTWAECYEKG